MAGKAGKFERSKEKLFQYLARECANYQYVKLSNKELGDILHKSPASIRDYLRELKKDGRVFLRVSRNPVETPEGKFWVNRRYLSTNKEY